MWSVGMGEYKHGAVVVSLNGNSGVKQIVATNKFPFAVRS